MVETPARKGVLVPLLFVLAGTGVLVWLGIWQLHRLAWKEALIAEIAARSTAAPQPLPAPASWPGLKPEAYEYRRVSARGHFDNAKEVLVFRTQGPRDLGAGYLVLTPLILASGDAVIVDRGFVPTDRAAKAARPQSQIAGEVTITGLMRPPQTRNVFTPADDPVHNLYFTRDPAAIAAHFRLARVAPFVIDQEKAAIPGGWPEGGATIGVIPNNHLEYALTWFGAAVGLWIVFGVHLAKVWQERRAGNRQA
jgi:surfeit locus 1 family protein